jgi:hypothetical protein
MGIAIRDGAQTDADQHQLFLDAEQDQGLSQPIQLSNIRHGAMEAMSRSANDLVACWRRLHARNDRQNASSNHLHTTAAATQPVIATVETAPIIDAVVANVDVAQPVDAQDEVDRKLYYTDVELFSMDRDQAFALPSPSRLEEIRLNAVQELRASADAMIPCCVCELDNEASVITVMNITPALLAVCISLRILNCGCRADTK